MLSIEYINHSGYVIETGNNIYIIDYVKGDLLPRYISSSKNVMFMVTHHHGDHFNKAIFDFNKPVILSYDLGDVGSQKATVLKEHEVLDLPSCRIRAFGSTDAGLSYLIEDGDHSILHCGDLNDWHWKDESTPQEIRQATTWFKEICADIVAFTPLDVLIAPVDPRMGSDFDAGARFMIDCFHPRAFFPMHFGSDLPSITAFKTWSKQQSGCTFHWPTNDNVCWIL